MHPARTDSSTSNLFSPVPCVPLYTVPVHTRCGSSRVPHNAIHCGGFMQCTPRDVVAAVSRTQVVEWLWKNGRPKPTNWRSTFFFLRSFSCSLGTVCCACGVRHLDFPRILFQMPCAAARGRFSIDFPTSLVHACARKAFFFQLLFVLKTSSINLCDPAPSRGNFISEQPCHPILSLTESATIPTR